MLCLTRREGERIIVDHNGARLTLTVVDCGHGKVRLGFEGDADFVIVREELTRRPPVDRRIGGAGFDAAHFPELEPESETACLACHEEECVCEEMLT